MIVDFDPSDNWADLLSPENPIKEAHDCGDGVTFDVYSRQTPGVGRGHPDYVMSGSDLAEFDRCPHRWLVGFRDDETRSTETPSPQSRASTIGFLPSIRSDQSSLMLKPVWFRLELRRDARGLNRQGLPPRR